MNTIHSIPHLWWLLPALLLLLAGSGMFKSIAGKRLVKPLLSLLLNRKDYRIFQNLTIPTEQGKSSIDLLIVSRFGLFVLNIEDIRGNISIAENGQQWTQQIGTNKRYFRSPRVSNKLHADIIQLRLGLESDQVIPLVAFVGNSRFTAPPPKQVTSGYRYLSYIRGFKEELFSAREMQNLVDEIEMGRLKPDVRSPASHSHFVRKIIEQGSAEQQSARACPKCGRPMVLRGPEDASLKDGHFWSCSAFPECSMVAVEE